MARTSLFICCLILGVYVGMQSSNTLVAQGQLQQDTLTQDTIAIEEVIIEQELSPEEKLEAKHAYHKEIFGLGDNKRMIMLNPLGGIAVNIQKLYNHFSRRGKGARRLQRIFEQEYEDDLVNQIWNPLVQEYILLQGDSLQKFNLYFKPELTFLNEASHYERVAYMVKSLKHYRDSADVIHKRLELKATP